MFQESNSPVETGMIKLSLLNSISNGELKEGDRLIKEVDEDQQLQIVEERDHSILYEKGVKSEEFIIILQGKVIVESGKDGFMVNLSTFNYFGAECLINDNYVPDFTARVSKYARILKIKCLDYKRAISDVQNFIR